MLPLVSTTMIGATVLPKNHDVSDFDKVLSALGMVKVSSLEDFLEAVGLGNMPTMHRYGVLFGCCTFVFTVTAVGALLFLGGSFKRIAEQSVNDKAPVPDAIQTRASRPLLLERLLEARERMMKQNYPGTNATQQSTRLTQMLLNVIPNEKEEPASQVIPVVDKEGTQKVAGVGGFLKKLLGPKENNTTSKTTTDKDAKSSNKKSNLPEGYEANYVHAYRRCQDKRGGPDIPGYPDARLEAYARAYAGCGTRTATNYRRSYARLYEFVACQNEGSMVFYQKLFDERPGDIVGRTVRLEPLNVEDHAKDLYKMTCGEGIDEINHQSFDPKMVWGFLDYGPFDSSSQLAKSRVFARLANEAGFAIRNNQTNRLMGVILLTNDDPLNLSIELEPPILTPDAKDTVHELEACFLLVDRLFAFGYRRIQMTMDVKDHLRKSLPSRLGFMQEGTLPRHKIVKEASRDSLVYGLLNSDWTKDGARQALMKKIHGAKAVTADGWNEVQEAELEMWQNHAAQQQQPQAAK